MVCSVTRLFVSQQRVWVVRQNDILSTITHVIGYRLHHPETQAMPLTVHIEFSGGAELLFNNIKKHDVRLPDNQLQPWTLKSLINWVKDNLLKERSELFVLGDTVRPGILVLVNNTDWELLGELNYQIQEGDSVVFISTLHGG